MNIPYIYEINREFFSSLDKSVTYIIIDSKSDEAEKVAQYLSPDKKKTYHIFMANLKTYTVIQHKINEGY